MTESNVKTNRLILLSIIGLPVTMILAATWLWVYVSSGELDLVGVLGTSNHGRLLNPPRQVANYHFENQFGAKVDIAQTEPKWTFLVRAEGQIGDDGSLGQAAVFQHGPGAHHGIVGAWGDGPQFRQESAHPHGVAVFGDRLYVADLGTNEVVSWSIDRAQSTLHPAGAVAVHDVAGPRHVQVTRSGQWAFALNELDNTLCAFRRSGDGTLEWAQTLSTIPDGWAEEHADPTTFPNEVYSKPSHASQLLIAPDDRFIYASNRGHDSIAVFALANDRMELVQIESSLGRIPWICCFSPDSRFLLVQNNHTRAGEEGPDSAAVFRRDGDSGLLKPTPARLTFPTISSVWSLAAD